MKPAYSRRPGKGSGPSGRLDPHVLIAISGAALGHVGPKPLTRCVTRTCDLPARPSVIACATCRLKRVRIKTLSCPEARGWRRSTMICPACTLKRPPRPVCRTDARYRPVTAIAWPRASCEAGHRRHSPTSCARQTLRLWPCSARALRAS